MHTDITLELQADKIKEAMLLGKRADGRKLDEYREISIQRNISENAEGSARVRLGMTDVMAGVKMLTGEPYPDNPDEGTISLGAEFLPMASPFFETGPPGVEETELARVVDRGIRESKALDFKSLCIKEKEKSWIVFVDLYILNDAGNLFDASAIAALAALLETKIPKLEDDAIVKGEYSGKLKLSRKPVLCTLSKISGKIVVDASAIEGQAMDARFSVSTTEDAYMAAFQKGGSGSFTAQEIDECIEIAFKKGKEIRELF